MKESLVKEFRRQRPDAPAPDRRDLAGRAWSRVPFGVVLAPDGA
ncbi:hypothetical protein ACFY6U_10590 [Streptomyces sp. NPDC013157]